MSDQSAVAPLFLEAHLEESGIVSRSFGIGGGFLLVTLIATGCTHFVAWA